MKNYKNINSQLDALKIKDVEKKFYSIMNDKDTIIPKVTPFKGINTDLIYIKNNQLLFIKFMDTTQDLFFILGEELIEVMHEEHQHLKEKMEKYHENINYKYVFIMPNLIIE